jgi:hypothetical protein
MRDGACLALTAFKIAAASASAHAASTGVAAKVRDDLRRPDDARIPLAVLLLCHIAMSIFTSEMAPSTARPMRPIAIARKSVRDDERMRVRELCGGRERAGQRSDSDDHQAYGSRSWSTSTVTAARRTVGVGDRRDRTKKIDVRRLRVVIIACSVVAALVCKQPRSSILKTVGLRVTVLGLGSWQHGRSRCFRA